MQIPFVDLKAQYESIKAEIDKSISEVIEHTAFVKGEHVKNFEQSFAELYGVKHVISCANGTDSLYIIMKMLGIGEGDEVITAANSWISSSETITQTGAKVVFSDPDDKYLSMDAEIVRELITPNTKAIMPVHLHGQVCDVDGIKELCEEHNIHMIEDCAQSHFSEYKGKRVGTIGIAGSFSFYPGKNLGAYGDAGCIITNDDALAEKCRMYANHGALKKHHHVMEGINSRMDGIQAAVLNVKLPYILDWTELRIRNASYYDNYLGDIKEVKTPVVRPETVHTYHVYMIQAEKRDELEKFLSENGVSTARHYPTALPNLPAYKYLGYTRDDYPVASELESQILSLPMYPELEEEQIKYVAEKVKEFYQ